jgi:hypothetical protein
MEKAFSHSASLFQKIVGARLADFIRPVKNKKRIGFSLEYESDSLRQFRARQTIQADPLFGGLQGQGAMRLRRNPHPEFSAVVFLRKRRGNRLTLRLQILDGFQHRFADSGKGFFLRSSKSGK